MKRVCKICKKEKHLDDFRKCKTGYYKTCKLCISTKLRNECSELKPKITSLRGEVWKDIERYKGFYKFSNKGRIRRLFREIQDSNGISKNIHEKIITTFVNQGYCYVCLRTTYGSRETEKVHRLIAEAFLPNPQNKETVNHKDGDKGNNHVSNLEWATRSENMKHAYDTGLNKSGLLGKTGALHHLSKAVNQYSLDGKFIKTFGSVNEAEWLVSFGVKKVLAGLCKTAGGFLWKYK